MSTTKTVELSVLLSIINSYDVLDVTSEQRIDVVNFILGENADSEEDSMFETAIGYLQENYPKIAEAAKLTASLSPDESRYNKLVDLFKMRHQIAPMEAMQPA